MSSPVIDSITLDHASYAVGAKITATVVFHDPDAKTWTLTGTATDGSGNKVNATATFAVTDPVTVTLADDGGRAWTLQSQPGVSPAVFTTTA